MRCPTGPDGEVRHLFVATARACLCGQERTDGVKVTPAPRVRRFDEPHTEPFTNDTLVEFEGEVCRWGDLMLADRKAWMYDGGYPF